MSFDINVLEFNKILEMIKPYAQTSMGKENIEKIIPFFDIQKVQVLLEEVSDASEIFIKYQNISLSDMHLDYNTVKRAIIGGILNERELLDVVSLINTVTGLSNFLKQANLLKIKTENLTMYFSNLIDLKILKSNITLAISEDGYVFDNASKELFIVRKGLQSATNRLRVKMNDLLVSNSSILSDNVIAIRNNRMCLPVKAEYKNSFKGIIHDESASKTTAYIEPESCIEINATITTLINKEKREIELILKNLSLLVSANADDINKNLEMIEILDVIFAKAAFFMKNDYYKPNLTDKMILELKNAKHPLIDKTKVVPININIGKKFKAIIITGPNTGGKTVTLKTVGLLCAMVQSGMFIPASNESIVPVFNDILVDIGDEQSIEQSLSTFSSHMTKIKEILKKADDKSLILLDELGSGTDPQEGSSLAISIIEYFETCNSTVIATTHYSDLKEYAYKNDYVSNASVEFSLETLMPTYRLLMGVPGKSNAIEIAKRLGINESIIENSRKLMGINKSESNILMDKLEEERERLNNDDKKLKEEISYYEKQKNLVEIEKKKLYTDTESIISKAKKEAEKILTKARDDAKELLDEISKLKEGSYKEHELADAKFKIRNIQTESNDDAVFQDNIEIGDFVYVKSYNQFGIVQDIKKNKYVVALGQFSISFDKNELRKEKKKETEVLQKEKKFSGFNPASSAKLSLDLRGKRFEELKDLLDAFVDQAQLGNLKQVTIIHGFGTGVVRNYVQDYLKKCSLVKEYRYGGEGEGLNGATVVTLK